MPVLRRPLRERRNVQLKVATSSIKENDFKTTSSVIKHSYIKAKAPVRGGLRHRHAHSYSLGKPAPGTRVPYVPQHTASDDEIKVDAEEEAFEEAGPTPVAAVPLSRELDIDVDQDVDLDSELENYDPFSTPRSSLTPIQGYHTPSSNPASPTFLQDVFIQDEADPLSLAYQNPSFYTAAEEDLQSVHEFLPFLFIAFSDGQYTPASLKASYGIDFTHILKIVYPSMTNTNDPGCVSSSVNKTTGVQTLTLTIPTSAAYSNHSSPSRRHGGRGRRHARPGISQRMHTLLTEEQLLAARDFLSLALPYYLEARPTSRKASGENVAVLLTAPGGDRSGFGMDEYSFGSEYGFDYSFNAFGRVGGGFGAGTSDNGGAADIISAVACYLSFASETPADTVLAYINEEEGLGDEWKDAVSRDEDGVGFVQRVAAM
ncbi:hypothetical protein AX17_004043 [Amanita inopinata Kibby_2008]|nr:hypothetical protein AX17_004043 [Amanita inopinata Kibby_2008]